MDSPEYIEDSQSDNQHETLLSWDTLPRSNQQRTRQQQQLKKLRKDLTPLTKEYKNLGSLRNRHTSFEKNSQFTVIAAEFLNLSTRKELNRLFDEGHSKEDIEDLLELKYQEKKHFFTDMNIKHHRFKRKNFEAWRSLSNSNSANTNTFMAEEELVSELPKNVQLRLKRLNNRPLVNFKSKVKTNSDAHTRKKAKNREQIPQENGLLDISIENNSSLMISDERPTDESRNGLIDSVLQERVRGTEQSAVEEPGIVALSNTEAADMGQLFNEPSSPIDRDQVSETVGEHSELKIFSQDSGHPPSDDKIDSLVELESLRINEEQEVHDTLGKPEPQFKSIHVLSSPVQSDITTMTYGKDPKIPTDLNADTIAVNGRHLRHRTIINRNPYLVDRAEYLGLSTRYQLISLEQKGMNDDTIIEFLDEIYQKRRSERKKKDIGYGPFSKPSFYDIMDTMNSAPLPNNNFVQEARAIDYQSDQEFEFSVDEEEEEEEAEEDDDDDVANTMHASEDSGDGLIPNWNTEPPASPYSVDEDATLLPAHRTASKKYLKLAPQALESTKYSIDHMVQKKSISRSGITPSLKLRPSLMKKSKTETPNKRRENEILKGKRASKSFELGKATLNKQHTLSNVTSLTDSNSEPISNPNSFNPYSMDMLTLLDDGSDPSSASPRNPVTYVEDGSASYNTTNKATTESSEAQATSKTKKASNTTSISELLSDVGLKKHARKRNLENNELTNPKTMKRKKKSHHPSRNIIAGSYAPKEADGFVFARKPMVESLTVAGSIASKVIPEMTISAYTELNVENAKGTTLPLKLDDSMNGPSENVLKARSKMLRIDVIWRELKSYNDLDERRYFFITKLKPGFYKEIHIPQTFLSSSLLLKVFDDSEDYYKSKNIKVDYQDTTLKFDMPVTEDAFYKLKAFLDLLLGSLETAAIPMFSLKQLRKCLIHLLILIWNSKRDAPELLGRLGLELNSFLNKYKRLTNIDDQAFCVFAPYFLLYMNLLQKLLPPSSEYLSSFRNTGVWLTKKIIAGICSVSFENIFIHRKTVVLESISLFFVCVRNPWSYVEAALHDKDFATLNITNFLFYCQSQKDVEMDWEIYTSLMNQYTSSTTSSKSQIHEVRSIFASILKINREFSWELEDQLIIKMFRVLAEYKFENIGSQKGPKATIYPNIPATDSLATDDGCLDIYFKVLNIFSKQYISESSKQMVERIVPVRSTFGYSPVQLQNRAMVLLLMVYIFDQDLLPGLESIIHDMIRDGSTYSINASLALLRTIVKQTPRRPYNIVRRYLPSLINKMNQMQNQKESLIVFKDLSIAVQELLNGQDISYLKRMLDFVGIILKVKIQDGYHFGIENIYESCFGTIRSQFEFIEGIVITAKDTQRIKKGLSDIVVNSKLRLTDERLTDKGLKKLYLKYWLFSNSKSESSAMQILYTEWSYFGSSELRKRFELTFFQYLVEWFDPSPVKGEVFDILFKYLPVLSVDISGLYNGVVSKGLIRVEKDKFRNINMEKLNDFREKISVQCLSSMLRFEDKELVGHVFSVFITSLKEQLINHSSRSYIRDVSFYLYTVADQMIDTPEWKYLVNVLKIETIAESLSKKMQFVETVDDVCTVLEKNYINSLAGGTYDKFMEQMKLLNGDVMKHGLVVDSFCAIIAFHVHQIENVQVSHWIHLSNWIHMMIRFMQSYLGEPKIAQVLSLVRYIGNLRMVYAGQFEYKHYYLTVLSAVYEILNWSASMLIGFGDMDLFVQNICLFTVMDPAIDLNNDYINHDEKQQPLMLKLAEIFERSKTLLDGKIIFEKDEKSIYELEKRISQTRDELRTMLCLSSDPVESKVT